MRGSGNSFDRIFARTPGDAPGAADGDKPTVHELFAAAMNDQLPLRDFARLLVELHDLHMTPAAARLLSSVDAASGRLSFAQFQRALGESAEGAQAHGAGHKTVFEDQASAIISDNCGAPCAPGPQGTTKLSTDISADREAVIKRSQQVSGQQSRGAFSSNPVMRTNRVSAANPLANPGGEGSAGSSGAATEGSADDPYGTREMAQTATRMYVGGELDRPGYEKFLQRFGIALDSESELRRLVEAHEKVGDGSFVVMARALQREIAKVEAA